MVANTLFNLGGQFTRGRGMSARPLRGMRAETLQDGQPEADRLAGTRLRRRARRGLRGRPE
jgi:hypothetical protein